MIQRTWQYSANHLPNDYSPKILVLGDSHAIVFKNKKFREAFKNYLFKVGYVDGATVSGLSNPHSKTNALKIFKYYITRLQPDITITLLGEVDVGFVIWYRAKKYNAEIRAMFDMAINNYQALLKFISTSSRAICISTPLPTISDDNDWGDVANKRKEIDATQLERTRLTLKFNNHMKTFCDEQNFIYLSFDNESIGDDGMVIPKLVNSQLNNHHYDADNYSDMIIDKLKLWL
uniref:SGNH hydrolase-type esterase domain-containing protein n=1 Tax=viral metagenome TaxID=1070528 RepID=A0A6H1ZTB1_9ZZZZ